MDVQHRARVVRFVVERPEALVGERDAVDVAEQHRAREAELVRPPARSSATDAAGSFSGSVASAANRGPRSATIFANASLHQRAKRIARSRRFDVRAGRRQA